MIHATQFFALPCLVSSFSMLLSVWESNTCALLIAVSISQPSFLWARESRGQLPEFHFTLCHPTANKCCHHGERSLTHTQTHFISLPSILQEYTTKDWREAGFVCQCATDRWRRHVLHRLKRNGRSYWGCHKQKWNGKALSCGWWRKKALTLRRKLSCQKAFLETLALLSYFLLKQRQLHLVAYKFFLYFFR